MTKYISPRSRSLANEMRFYQRLGTEADVRLEPGYNQDEIFDDQFRRRASEIQRTPGSSGGVAIVPAKRGPWSGNNQLGNDRAFSNNDNNQQTILRLDEWDFPQVWSVMLGLTFPPSGASDFKIVAQVNPGVGGFVDSFEVDWLHGTTFNVCMNALNIVALYDEVTSAPNGLRLSAMIAKRPLNGTAPQRTFEATIAASDTAFISIPKYAKRLRIIAGAAAATHLEFAATANYRFLSGASSGVVRAEFFGSEIAPIYGNSIPIPGGVQSLRINNGGGASMTPVCIFELAL